MSETPSKRRRKGREAFSPGANPMEFQPYKLGTWVYDYHLRDWLDGWKEAEEQFEAEQIKKEKETCSCGEGLTAEGYCPICDKV